MSRTKSTTLGGRVLRARTPAGVDQEVCALLVTYQALRIAISDAFGKWSELDPDRWPHPASFVPVARPSPRAQDDRPRQAARA